MKESTGLKNTQFARLQDIPFRFKKENDSSRLKEISLAENAIATLEQKTKEFIEEGLNDIGFTEDSPIHISQRHDYNNAYAHYDRYVFMKEWKTKYGQNQAQKIKKTTNLKSNKKNPFNNTEYFKARFLYECCLEVIKLKGYFDLEDALAINQRIGFYYDQYYQSISEKDRKLSLESPIELLTSIGLENVNAVIPGVISNQEGDFWGIKNWMDRYHSSFSLDSLLALWRCPNDLDLQNWIRQYFTKQRFTNEEKQLDEIFKTDPCKVYPNFDDGPLYFFENVKKENLLFSETLLNIQTRKPYLQYNKQNTTKAIKPNSLKWNKAILVQDYGFSCTKTLLEYIRDLNDKNKKLPASDNQITISLIVSNIRYGRHSAITIYEALANQKLKINLRIDVYYTPPNLHNHHLHVFYKLTGNNIKDIEFYQSCYYYKRTTRNEMNGVYFDNDRKNGDHKELLSNNANHQGILYSGLRALSRSMWIASVYLHEDEYFSIDMVSKDSTNGLHKIYEEFKQQVFFRGTYTKENFKCFDKHSKSYYKDKWRIVKPGLQEVNPLCKAPRTADFAPAEDLEENINGGRNNLKSSKH